MLLSTKSIKYRKACYPLAFDIDLAIRRSEKKLSEMYSRPG